MESVSKDRCVYCLNPVPRRSVPLGHHVLCKKCIDVAIKAYRTDTKDYKKVLKPEILEMISSSLYGIIECFGSMDKDMAISSTFWGICGENAPTYQKDVWDFEIEPHVFKKYPNLVLKKGIYYYIGVNSEECI
jgi:hypothetical protein